VAEVEAGAEEVAEGAGAAEVEAEEAAEVEAAAAEVVEAGEVEAAAAAVAVAEEAAAVEENLHEKAPDLPHGRRCHEQPLAPELPTAAPASGARSSGRAGLAWPDAQPSPPEVAFRCR
jgi:hypothetical protein